MPEGDKVYVVGALASEFTPPKELIESNCLIECSMCKEKLWISVWNMEKKAICLHCISNIEGEVEFGITDEDREASSEYIRKDMEKKEER